MDAVQEGIDEANTHLARVEQLKKFTIVPGDRLPGGDELTPTMKLERKPIAQKYQEAIEAMYSGLAVPDRLRLATQSAEKVMMGKMARGGWRGAVMVAGVTAVVSLAIVVQGSASAANPAPIALPDMRIFVPTNLISIGIDSSTGHRELRFTHKTADIGAGPFEIDPHYNSRTGVSTFTQRIYRETSPGVWVADHSVPLAVTGTWEPPSDYRFPLTRFTLNKVGTGGSPGAVVAVSPKVDYCITGDTQIQGIPNEPNQTAIPVE